MAVYKEDNKKWYVRGSYTDERGKLYNYKRVAKGCITKKEAQKFEIDLVDKLQAEANNTGHTGMTFKEMFDRYQKDMRESKSKRITTIRSNDERIVIFKDLFEKAADDLKAIDFREILDDMIEQDYSISYVNTLRSVPSRVYRYAIRNEWVKYNPVAAIPEYKDADAIPEPHKILTTEQWKTFQETWSYEDDYQHYTVYTILNTLFYMGMRRGEALALAPSDVDLVNRTIHINKSLTPYVDGKKYHIGPPKTQRGYRTIRIPLKLMPIMEKYFEMFNSMYGSSQAILLFGIDDFIVPKTIKKYFDHTLKAANLPQLKIHDLRHSHASFLINNTHKGLNKKAIADRLGDTESMIEKTYAHLFKATELEMMDIVDEILDKG